MKKKYFFNALIAFAILLSPNLNAQWSQVGNDIDGEAQGDESGFANAISADGTTIAVGAYANDGNGNAAGHVRIFKNIAGAWVQHGADIDGEAANDFFGYSVSLSDDGSIVAIGSYQNSGSAPIAGHVRVFKYIAGTWTQQGAAMEGEAAYDRFGSSVSLSADGSVVAVGAWFNAGNGTNAGHTRVFKNIAGTWTQQGADIDGEAANDYSGQPVSLSADGSFVAIGAFNNNGNGAGSGHARVFKNISGSWVQQGADIDGEAAGDNSGYSVSLSDDGSIIAIGAYGNDGNGSNAGHARIYKNISGVWVQQGAAIDGEAAGDGSGFTVSLSADGSIVAIGAPFNDGNGSNAGHVRIFKNIAGSWVQFGTDIDGEFAGDRAETVSLSADGKTVVIGARYNNGNGSASGHVRVFEACTPPAAPINAIASPSVISCGQSSNLNATSAGNTINWYTVPTGGTPIGSSASGANFSVSPGANITYYAEADRNQGCLSETRQSVTITVGPAAPPTNATATPSAISCGQSSNLSATSAGNIIAWYTTPTGGTSIGTSASGASFSVSPSATTTYYAEATSSSTNTYLIPVTQLINVPNACGTGSRYGGGAIGFNWTDIGTTTPTNIEIQFGQGVDCNSAGIAHTYTLNGVAAGSYTPSGNWCSCGFIDNVITINPSTAGYVVGGSNTLLIGNNSFAFGFINNTASLGASYAKITVTSGATCTSATRTPVTITVGLPSPTNAIATPSAICPGGSSDLSATSAGNTIEWYTTPTGGSSIGTSASGANFSVSPTANTTYYAETNANTSVTNVYNIGLSDLINLSSNCGTDGAYNNCSGNAGFQWNDISAGVVTSVQIQFVQGLDINGGNYYTTINGNNAGTFGGILNYNCTSTNIVTLNPAATGYSVGANNTFMITGIQSCFGLSRNVNQTFGSDFARVTVVTGGSCTSTTRTPVTVTLNEAPVITCPASIAENTDANACTAAVSYTPSVTGTTPVITYAFTGATTGSGNGDGSGSAFNKGTTTVTLTATNTCATTSCSFDVVVTDAEVPTITCSPDITGVLATSAAGAVVNYTAPVGTDNCPGATTALLSGPASGATFPIGTTTVTYEVTDAANNSIQCSFDVTVVGVAPQISCPANVVVNNDAGQCGAIVNYTATESVGIPASVITYTLAPGSFFNKGTVAVTATATNAVGSSSCTFDVTVNDNEAPVMLTMPATVTLVNGVASIVAGDVDGGTKDNCAVTDLSVSPSTFNCTTLGAQTITLTAVDASNNISSATAIVTVLGAVPMCSITSVPSSSVYTGGNPNTLYLGYGAQSTTLSASSTGGSSWTYNWSGTGLNNTNTANPVFSPTSAGTYTFTATSTNEFGCSSTCDITIDVIDANCSNNNNNYKVLICHEGNTICVSTNAVSSHIGVHPGDYLGPCSSSSKIELNVDEFDVVAYPSPFTDAFHVDLITGSSSNYSMELFDMNGKLLESYQDLELKYNPDLGINLPQGFYMLRVSQDGNTKMVKVTKVY